MKQWRLGIKRWELRVVDEGGSIDSVGHVRNEREGRLLGVSLASSEVMRPDTPIVEVLLLNPAKQVIARFSVDRQLA